MFVIRRHPRQMVSAKQEKKTLQQYTNENARWSQLQVYLKKKMQI
jgi:hypothetical protein